MKFYPYGPYEVPRNGRLIARDKKSKKLFWEQLEAQEKGISEACGCYIFTINGKAWYVGMAERQTFKLECFSLHKIVQYNEALQQVKGKPKIIFLAKLTPSDNFSKPSKRGHIDITVLENMLIGLALSKNPRLQNVKGTKFLKEMQVPGILNTRKGVGHSAAVQTFKKSLGI